jgi:hypothetical protein
MSRNFEPILIPPLSAAVGSLFQRRGGAQLTKLKKKMAFVNIYYDIRI